MPTLYRNELEQRADKSLLGKKRVGSLHIVAKGEVAKMPYYKYLGKIKEEHTFICEICARGRDQPTAKAPDGWIVTRAGRDEGTRCYCEDHSREAHTQLLAV